MTSQASGLSVYRRYVCVYIYTTPMHIILGYYCCQGSLSNLTHQSIFGIFSTGMRQYVKPFDNVWFLIRQCLIPHSPMFDSSFDKFDSSFNNVWFLIRQCLIPHSPMFDSSFDKFDSSFNNVWFLIWQYVKSFDNVWFLIRQYVKPFDNVWFLNQQCLIPHSTSVHILSHTVFFSF